MERGVGRGLTAEDEKLSTELAQARNIGETVFILRRRAGMTRPVLAKRAGISESMLGELEHGRDLDRLRYDEWMALIRSTQPERPDWWDEGHEHDLSVGAYGDVSSAPENPEYWERIARVREGIRQRYRRG